MGKFGRALDVSKVAVLTLVVIVSFIMSSFGWRHIETSETTRLLVAGAILLAMYALMVFELVNRNLAALIGAAVSVAAYDCLVGYIEMEQIVQWEDLETLSLLFGMMIIVNVIGCSGLFDYLAVWTYKQSAGNFWSLIIIMSFITAFLSAFIDNVSTMLLMSPTLIKLSELEHIDPRYMLMLMVIFCNIGGTATPVGDPPNLIIINDQLISSLGITFGSFTCYSGPCVLITIASVLLYVKLKYKSKEGFRVENYAQNKSIELIETSDQLSAVKSQEVKIKELAMRLRTMLQEHHRRAKQQAGGDGQSAPGVDDKFVQSLEKQIGRLEYELDRTVAAAKRTSTSGGVQLDNYQQMKQDQLALEHRATNVRRGSRLTDTEIVQLLRRHSIKSRSILVLSLSVLFITIMLFFVQSLPGIRLTLGWVSLFAGLTLLVACSSIEVAGHSDHDQEPSQEDDGHGSDKSSLSFVSVVGGGEASASSRGTDHDQDQDSNEGKDSESDKDHDNFEVVVNNIEWSTLMFFFALFIVMEVMAKLGLIKFFGSQITGLVDLLPEGPMRSIGAITIILWSSGLASACIDNVPFTSMMIKVLGSIALNSGNGLDTKPLVFALAFGACYGGNGTLIGASANLVTAGLASRHNYPITFNNFFNFAAPATILSLVIANIYLVVVFVLLGL